MPRILFASAFRRAVDAPPEEVVGDTVRATLDDYFTRHPTVRGYVLDEQGALRKHVAIFVDGHPMPDRAHLAVAVDAGAEVHVIQALSGG